MSDIRLDPVTGDIDLTGNKISLTEEGSESTAQRIRITLKTNQGEWGFNTDFGIKYYELIFRKSTSKAIVDAEFRSKILSVPGVSQIAFFESNLDNSTRTYTLNFTVVDDTGNTVELTL